MLRAIRAALPALGLLWGLAFAAPALATGGVHIEFVKGAHVYAAQTITSSGTSTQSSAAPSFGGSTGQARISVTTGAVIVTWEGMSPTATQTNGVRLQAGMDPMTVAVVEGQKIAIIEATEGPSTGSTTCSGCTFTGTVTANAGTNLNTSLLGLESTQSGFKTANHSDLLAVEAYVDGIEGLVGTTNTEVTTFTNANHTDLLAVQGYVDGLEGLVGTTNTNTGTTATNTGTTATNTGTTATNTGTTNTLLAALNYAQAANTSGQVGPIVQCAATTAAPSYTTAKSYPLSCDTAGGLRTAGGGVAQGSTTSGQSGTLVQCAVTTSAPSYTTAQTNPLSCDTSGGLRTAGGGVAQASTTSGQSGTLSQCAVTTSAPSYTTAQTDPHSCDTDGSQRVHDYPTTDSEAGVAPVVTSAVASSKVICAAACNLFELNLTTGASAGYVLVRDATSEAGDGAVTPVKCYQIAANSSIGVAFGPALRMSTGATVTFSTTGCFTQTKSATAFISGEGL